jgi:membrane protease YdiL (CAAX protease family)
VFAAGYLAGDLLRARLAPDRDLGIVLVEGTWTLLLLAWLRAFHPGWIRSVGWPGRPWAEAREAAVYGAILYGVIALAVALPLSRILGAAGAGAGAGRNAGGSAAQVAAALGSALLVAPAAEELFFRGLLYRALRSRSGAVPAAVVSALAFGLAHLSRGDPAGSVVPVTVAICLGLGLALLYERRGNLVAPLAAHEAFNAIGVLVLLART